jgi:hypothetical protein
MPPVFISVTRHSLDLKASMPVYDRDFSIPVEQVVEVGVQLDL